MCGAAQDFRPFGKDYSNLDGILPRPALNEELNSVQVKDRNVPFVDLNLQIGHEALYLRTGPHRCGDNVITDNSGRWSVYVPSEYGTRRVHRLAR
jgi:hypothetical protein